MVLCRFSYDVGLIHFVGMSTEHDYTVGSEQHSWLDADLAAVDRTGTVCLPACRLLDPLLVSACLSACLSVCLSACFHICLSHMLSI